MSRIALALVVLIATALGCAAPTPAPTDCWRSLRATYHLGDMPPDAAIEQAPNAAGIMQDRLSAMGLAEFRVAVDTGVITIDLPAMDAENQAEVRALLLPRGDLSLVPIPAAQPVEAGDPAPVGVAPIAVRADITRVRRTADAGEQPALEITLSDAAGQRMLDYTTEHVGDQMAIVLDGSVLSAPHINEPFSTGIQVSGGFAETPFERIATILQFGAYPGPMVEDSFGAAPPPANCPA